MSFSFYPTEIISHNSLAVTVGQCLGDPETNWYQTTRSQENEATPSQDIPVVQTPGSEQNLGN